jgi:hypothetical protein
MHCPSNCFCVIQPCSTDGATLHICKWCKHCINFHFSHAATVVWPISTDMPFVPLFCRGSVECIAWLALMTCGLWFRWAPPPQYNAMVNTSVCTHAVPCRAHNFMSWLHSLSASSCLTYEAKDCAQCVCVLHCSIICLWILLYWLCLCVYLFVCRMGFYCIKLVLSFQWLSLQ